MAKQYLHKNNETYLKDEYVPHKVSYSMWAIMYIQNMVYHRDAEVGKAAKNIQQYLVNLGFGQVYPSNMRNTEFEDESKYSFFNKKTNEKILLSELKKKIEELKTYSLSLTNPGLINITQHVLLPFVTPTTYLNPEEKGPKANHKISMVVEEARTSLATIQALAEKEPEWITDVLSFVDSTRYGYRNEDGVSGFIATYGLKVAKSTLIEHLNTMSASFEELALLVKEKCSNFEPADYKLRYYEPKAINNIEDIKNKKAYYLFTSYGEGGFLTLNRTSHGRIMYEWGVSKNIDTAFLFQAPIEKYAPEIGAYLSKSAQIFINMDFKEVNTTIEHPTIDAIRSLIDKKDITRMLEAVPVKSETEQSSSEQEIVQPVKRKNKI